MLNISKAARYFIKKIEAYNTHTRPCLITTLKKKSLMPKAFDLPAHAITYLDAQTIQLQHRVVESIKIALPGCDPLR